MTIEHGLRGLVAVALADVHPSPDNPRERLTEIDDLAASIAEVGLIQPVVVQKVPGRDGYELVSGHRRHAAVRKLGWAKIPVLVRRDMLPDEELLAMLAENGQRTDLDPIEEARAYSRLVGMGLTHAEIARRIGRSQALVTNRLALLQLPVSEQEEIRAGSLTVGHVLASARAERREERLRAKGRPIGRPPGAKTKPYFSDDHPLAKAVRALCEHRQGRPKLGGVACGQCWEAAIRADAIEAALAPYNPEEATA